MGILDFLFPKRKKKETQSSEVSATGVHFNFQEKPPHLEDAICPEKIVAKEDEQSSAHRPAVSLSSATTRERQSGASVSLNEDGIVIRRSMGSALSLPSNPFVSERERSGHSDSVEYKKVVLSRLFALPDSTAHLKINGIASVAWQAEPSRRLDAIQVPSELSTLLALGTNPRRGAREVCIGLDFGTSSTKVVITDKTLKKAYAVPFQRGTSIDAYLLPAQLGEDRGFFNIDGRGELHRDLKLGLLSGQGSGDVEDIAAVRVCAFLAYVLQYARAWLLSEYRTEFTDKEIFWSVAIGQPADQASYEPLKVLFRDLIRVAWVLSRRYGPIEVERAGEVWRGRTNLEQVDDEVEVIPIPEIAAQIHGFLVSSSFDPRAKNIFLMVDVGAGTVDGTVFGVKKEEDGRVSFRFFTNKVNFLGSVNLNRRRVTWWQRAFLKSDTGTNLVFELEMLRLPTEYRGYFPASYKEYVNGVTVRDLGAEGNPDEKFFDEVKVQIRRDLLSECRKSNLLREEDIRDIPFIFCGGGSRHPLYRRLIQNLASTPGATWMQVKHRIIDKPSDLVAPNLVKSEYDRLSVAYGLSQIDLGVIKQVQATAKPLSRRPDFTDLYIGKEYT